jgi:hypothetical protein
MVSDNNRSFYTAFMNVEFVVDLELPKNEMFSIFYRFPSKEFSNWKKLSDEAEFFADLKQAVTSERMALNDGNENPVG